MCPEQTKTFQMLAFIQSQRSVVERILRHIEAPAIIDLLVRIIQLDEHPVGVGVLEVCVCPCLSCTSSLDQAACSGSLKRD